ncbi:aldo/keto reductase [Microbacterium sp. JZ37]|uniref:aldo/keto reductase n=1 Tax=Microbacterium sp. JZ37 TaxID=2654193 RepID=UPI002B48662C|nr:aldo/keto reductase [Microbacterium sp. JZ37]WRH18465.1 aldo/keto reductase [Microbacterium sp. JZ37]
MSSLLDPRPLGATPLVVSPVTLGASSLGDPQRSASDPLEVAEAMLSSRFAVVDTSNNYAGGESERVLGRALDARGGLADGHSIVTKVDVGKDGRFDRDRVWRSFEESVEKLGLERFPLVHLHDPWAVTVEEALAPGGAVQGMIELREQGRAGAIGIAVGEISLEKAYVGTGIFDAVLTHNRMTIVDRSAEELIAEANERGMGVFNAAPFGGGLLAGTSTSYAYREAPADLLAWLARVRELCAEWKLSVPAAALHFSLRHPGVHSTVVGVGRPERIAELEELCATHVPDEFWPELEKLGTPPSTVED